MKTKIFVAVLVALFAISVVPLSKLIAAKPDKRKPVHATDVKLVKKITLKGRPSWAGGGKPKKQAATGVLGEPVAGEARYAVVVGISDYPGVENDLNYCDDDASEMAQALTNIYSFTNVTLLLDLAATREAILTTIDNMPVDADEVVFFFSGHGMEGIADDGDKEKKDEAIVTHNGTDSLVPIWDGELRDAFAGFATSRIILIFDTCLAGGMKKDLEASGRVIAMASTERGLSYEIPALQNGEFSYYFIDEGMLQGKANIHDYDGDETLQEPEQVTVEEAFDYTKANCDYDRPTIGDSFDDDLLL
jgi:hypothetical protein